MAKRDVFTLALLLTTVFTVLTVSNLLNALQSASMDLWSTITMIVSALVLIGAVALAIRTRPSKWDNGAP